MPLVRILGLICLLLGVPRPTGAQPATPPPASPVIKNGDFAGLVDIGGRSLYLECRGEGSPTVILVAGYRDRGDSWSTDLLQPDSDRTMVRPGVATFTRVCAYDRPGTVLDEGTGSRSDPVPQPQTGADAVADLRALLGAAAIPGPYVLVGHSYGGLVVRLYTSTYPADVVGLVLVDALPAVETWLTPSQWAAYQQLLSQRPAEFADYQDLETVDFAATAAQMREAPPLPSLPLVILTRVRPFDLPPDLPPDFSADALERAWAAGQAELAQLVPGARHVLATESGHNIHLDQPELVIAAVQQVVEAVRDPSTWPTPQATPSVSRAVTREPIFAVFRSGNERYSYDLPINPPPRYANDAVRRRGSRPDPCPRCRPSLDTDRGERGEDYS